MSKRIYYPVLGKRYGNLTIIDEEIRKTKDGKILYHVQCDCGKDLWIRAYFLEKGRQTSCKSCSQRKAVYTSNGRRLFIDKGHDGVGDLTKTYFGYLKRNAIRRNLIWNLDINYLWDLYLAQDKKCALSGIPIVITPTRKNSNVNFDLQTASLDRIDSKKGYEPGNVQWVHKDINKMKLDYDQQYFIDICTKIANHANQQPN